MAIVDVFNRINKLKLSSCGRFKKRSIKISNMKMTLQKAFEMF